MTLNLMIVSTSGIWQSSDHRLTDLNTAQLLDDFSVKHLCLRCRDGSALLAYAGIGSIRGVHISDWIKEFLRGESRTLDESFILLRENATRDLAPLLQQHNVRHMFSIGAFINGRPWAVQIRNFAVKDNRFGPPLDHFETAAREIPGPGQGFQFGDPAAMRREDLERLMLIATRTPRKPKDFRYLLASLNKRASETPSGRRTVSQHCVTTYMPPTGEPFESEFHDLSHPPKQMIVPILLFGIDLSVTQRTMLEHMEELQKWREKGDPSLPEPTHIVTDEGVKPNNRLRP